MSEGPRQRLVRRLFGTTIIGLRLAIRADRRLLIISACAQLVSGLLLGLQILVIRDLLDSIIASEAHRAPLSSAAWPIVWLVLIMGASSTIGATNSQLQRLLGELTIREVWKEILDVSTVVELRDYDSPEFYDRLQRVTTNAVAQPFRITQGLITLIGTLAGGTALAVAVITIYPVLLPLVLVAGLPTYLAARLSSRIEFRFLVAQAPRVRLRTYLSSTLTSREDAKEVRAFGLAGALRARYLYVYEVFIAALRHNVGRRSLVALFGSLISAAILGGTLLLIVWLVVHGHLSLAAAGAAVVAVRSLAGQISGTFSNISQIQESRMFLDDLQSFVRDYSDSADHEQLGTLPPDSFERIEVRDVSFSYLGSDGPVLEHIDMSIEHGEVIALVGENGSGKTTLSKLLADLYQPTSGAILWDGVDIGGYQPRAVRRRIAVIFQDFVRFKLPARDNIMFGSADEELDVSRLARAVAAAGAETVIDGLPDGYDTVLSAEYTSGLELSGGQWQRIALARAFYRDAPLVILDEPSASLDPRAEYELFASLRTLFAGRTVLFVSHRMATVRGADRIYVMSDGHIVESGTHDELMQLDGRYAELFALQAAGFSAPANPTPVE